MLTPSHIMHTTHSMTIMLIMTSLNAAQSILWLMMNACMGSMVYYFKVLRPIISSIAIFVVDIFVAMQFSSEYFFHDVSMLSDSLSVMRDNNITIRSEFSCTTLSNDHSIWSWRSVFLESNVVHWAHPASLVSLFAGANRASFHGGEYGIGECLVQA